MGTSFSSDSRINSTYKSMSFWDKIKFRIVHFFDRHLPWHKQNLVLGGLYLFLRRSLHQSYNLINVGTAAPNDEPLALFRTAEGEDVVSTGDDTGAEKSFFGRNGRPAFTNELLDDPHPSIVATKLLERKELQDTGKQFNMLAASWIQFMIHDWVDHLEDTNEEVVIDAPTSVAAQCPLKRFRFYATKREETGREAVPLGHRNRRTAWWDGSVIYGSNLEEQKKVRTFEDGKLKIDKETGLLQHNTTGVGIVGDVRNTWAGISLLQALFIKEHNAVCEMLKAKYPHFGDEELFKRARLVVAAVIAKIHTIDWTVELLKTKTLHFGMRANWYGILGKWFKDTFGHTGISLLSGFIGMKNPDNHGVPYSLTEEFVSVYRLHPLLPEEIQLRNLQEEPLDKATKTPSKGTKIPMLELIGARGEASLSKVGNERMLASLGHQASGALVLRNFPSWMRDLPPTSVDGVELKEHIDMAALEIYRDRERGIPRYNDFRRNMLMVPIQKWSDLTDDTEAIQVLRELYGDNVDKLDLLVGLMAEKKIEGFAISETSFNIFLLMATRRLEADPFFTTHFNSKVYTKEGLAWVNTTESLRHVLERHHGEFTKKWLNANSAFSVWSA